MKKPNIEKVEFQFSDGVHVVWVKEGTSWVITRYEHGYDSSVSVKTLQLPKLENAIYWKTKLQPKQS